MSTFTEAAHPRAGDGKFTTKPQSEQAVSLSVPFSQQSGEDQYRFLVRTIAQHAPEIVADRYQVPVQDVPDRVDELIERDIAGSEPGQRAFAPEEDTFEYERRRGDPFVRIESLADEVTLDINESAGGDNTVAGDASFRRTWATGNPDFPYISATQTYYAVSYIVDDSSARALTATEHKDRIDADAKLVKLTEHAKRARARGRDLRATVLEAEAQAIRDENPGELRYAVEAETEWLAHTDRDDLGISELWSDYVYEDVGDVWIGSLPDARAVLQSKARTAEKTWHQDFTPQNAGRPG